MELTPHHASVELELLLGQLERSGHSASLRWVNGVLELAVHVDGTERSVHIHGRSTAELVIALRRAFPTVDRAR